MTTIEQRLAALEAQVKSNQADSDQSLITIHRRIDRLNKPTDTPPVAPEYRMLAVGEVIREGDEWFYGVTGTWTRFATVGHPVPNGSQCRRRVVPDEKPKAEGMDDAVESIAKVITAWIAINRDCKPIAEGIIAKIKAGKVPGIVAKADPLTSWSEAFLIRAREAERERDSLRAEVDSLKWLAAKESK